METEHDRSRSVFNQTNIGTVSRATSETAWIACGPFRALRCHLELKLELKLETEASHQTCQFTPSDYTDIRPASPSIDPLTPAAWQGSHYFLRQCYDAWFDLRISRSWCAHLTTRLSRRLSCAKRASAESTGLPSSRTACNGSCCLLVA